MWILGRIYCTGTPEDYAAVHKLQDEISARAAQRLRQALHAARRQGRSKHRHEDAGARSGERAYCRGLLQLAGHAPERQPARQSRRADGREAGQARCCSWRRLSTLSKLGDEGAKALAEVPKLGFEKIMGHFKEAGRMENGWIFSTKTGLYGTDYLQRAFVTAIGLGANRPQDAVYPTSEADADGKPYSGANKYVMHFPKGQLPPVNGFWSLTMYNGEYFFVANPLNRYSISARQNLKANADGSMDLYIQNESPGTGQGIQLASCADGQVHPHASPVLAKGEKSFDHQRDVEDPGG